MIGSDEHQALLVGELIAKKVTSQLTAEEAVIVDEWLQRSPLYRQAYEELLQVHQQGGPVEADERVPEYDLPAALQGVLGRYRALESQQGKKTRSFVRYAAAAVLVLLSLALGVYWFEILDLSTKPDQTTYLTETSPAPGSHKAFLTLADGRTVELSESHTGIVIGDDITYGDGSAVLPDAVANRPQLEYLTMTTPRGGFYQVSLPDGSQVWLNADSRLTYPNRFEGTERVVELSGEAYFDVKPASMGSSGRSMPFVVVTAGQRVEVLGTEFNVTAYADETVVKTTLVTGRVQVQSADGGADAISLVPGEQAILHEGSVSKQNVDVEAFTAWRNGWFIFQDRPFAEMMNDIARWYDIEIVYSGGEVPSEVGFGMIRRSSELQDVIRMIESVGIACRLEGRRLTIGK